MCWPHSAAWRRPLSGLVRRRDSHGKDSDARSNATEFYTHCRSCNLINNSRILSASDRIRTGYIGLGNRGDQVHDAFLENGGNEAAAVVFAGHSSTSAILLENIAHKTKSHLHWDARAERFTNNEAANRWLSYKYRVPYEPA